MRPGCDQRMEQPETGTATPPPPSYPDVMTNRSSYHIEGDEAEDRREKTCVHESASVSPAVVVTGTWQRGKSVLDCNRHMLEHQLACDVWFTVGDRQGEGETTHGERVGAHAYVLQSRSGAFFALLAAGSGSHGDGVDAVVDVGAGSDRRRSVEFRLPHTRPKVFWQLLRYLYYEELYPQKDTVMELLSLAEKYDVVSVRYACLQFLHGCLVDDTVCNILEISHRYDDQELGKECLLYIRKHGTEEMLLAGVGRLCKECLNKVLTLEGLELTPTQRQEIADTWERRHSHDNHHHQDNHHQEPTINTNMHSPLNDVVYVKQDPTRSHRFLLDGPLDTRQRRHSSAAHRENHPPPMHPELRPRSRTPDPDSVSLASEFSTGSKSSRRSRPSRRSARLRDSKKSQKAASLSLTRLPSFSAWPDLNQVTRFNELSGSVANTGAADAISFTVDRSIYLYGFGVYGNINPNEEASFKVGTILTRKKHDILFETITITGVGAILPAMLETPVKMEKGKLYTLEIYVQGPPSHWGTRGQQTLEAGNETFTFYKAPASIKENRTTVYSGQIPRLYYLPY